MDTFGIIKVILASLSALVLLFILVVLAIHDFTKGNRKETDFDIEVDSEIKKEGIWTKVINIVGGIILLIVICFFIYVLSNSPFCSDC